MSTFMFGIFNRVLHLFGSGDTAFFKNGVMTLSMNKVKR